MHTSSSLGLSVAASSFCSTHFCFLDRSFWIIPPRKRCQDLEDTDKILKRGFQRDDSKTERRTERAGEMEETGKRERKKECERDTVRGGSGGQER